MIQAPLRCCAYLVAALSLGCGSDGEGTAGSAGDGGAGGVAATGGTAGMGGAAGAAGTGGIGGASGVGGTAGMGGAGGMDGDSPTIALVAANARLMFEVCDCSDGVERPLGSLDPVCFAEIPGPLPLPEQVPCLDAVIAGSSAARDWATCRTGAAETGRACWSAVAACDEMMEDACRAAFIADFVVCILPSAEDEAIRQCLTPSPESLLDRFDGAIAEGCACEPDPGACIATGATSARARSCIVDGINLGLGSTNPSVSDGTAEALRCLGERYLRWQICLSRINGCEPSEIEGCTNRYGPLSSSCFFPNDPPEMVQTVLAGCR
jgi:hypothetical protein